MVADFSTCVKTGAEEGSAARESSSTLMESDGDDSGAGSSTGDDVITKRGSLSLFTTDAGEVLA